MGFWHRRNRSRVHHFSQSSRRDDYPYIVDKGESYESKDDEKDIKGRYRKFVGGFVLLTVALIIVLLIS